MRFIVRPGSDPIARADSALLSAMGLPGGGVISVGDTHVAVAAGDVPAPTALTLGPRAMVNAGVKDGETVDAKRAILPSARRVAIAEDIRRLAHRHYDGSGAALPARARIIQAHAS